MKERDAGHELHTRVEFDDAYLGGERTGKRGRGAAGKLGFIAALETSDDGKPRRMVLHPLTAGFTWARGTAVRSGTSVAPSLGVQRRAGLLQRRGRSALRASAARHGWWASSGAASAVAVGQHPARQHQVRPAWHLSPLRLEARLRAILLNSSIVSTDVSI